MAKSWWYAYRTFVLLPFSPGILCIETSFKWIYLKTGVKPQIYAQNTDVTLGWELKPWKLSISVFAVLKLLILKKFMPQKFSF